MSCPNCRSNGILGKSIRLNIKVNLYFNPNETVRIFHQHSKISMKCDLVNYIRSGSKIPFGSF